MTSTLCYVLLLTFFYSIHGDNSDELTGLNAPVDQFNEFCQLEAMKGRCRWKSEVIVMTSARWGRMKTGRCLNIHPNFLAMHGQDPLFLGCSEDVLSIVDKKCSGRSECDVRIPDTDLDKVTPCYPDQKSYLEASYACVKVVQESRSCIVAVASEQQFISSPSSSLPDSATISMSSCGSRVNPWRLEAPAGQRINVSLLDFTAASRDRDVTCLQYGYVVEKSNKKNVSICANNGASGSVMRETTSTVPRLQREVPMFTSDTNSVDIVMLAAISNYNYLIKVNAIGCTNMVPPDNAWLKRSNNDIVIGCYLSQQTWQLKCDGHEWKGQVGECVESFMAMVVVSGSALIICIAVIIVGVMCLHRRKTSYKSKRTSYKAEEHRHSKVEQNQLHSAV